MAKHPHQLYLQEKRTWRCKIEGCSFFVHLGLQHVLIGKTALCFQCGETYTVDDDTLKFDTGMCYECRHGDKTALDNAYALIEKYNKKQSSIPPEEVGLSTIERLHLRARKNAEAAKRELIEEDEIEVIEAEESHAADCMAPYGGECSCK